MSLKNIISTIVVSMVAVSMIACDSKSSKKGSSKSTPANVTAQADNSLESQLEKVNAEIKELEEKKGKILLIGSEDSLVLEDAKKAFNTSNSNWNKSFRALNALKAEYASSDLEAQPSIEAEMQKTQVELDKFSKEVFKNAHAVVNIKETMEEETKEVKSIDLKLKDKYLVKESLELQIDVEVIKSSDDYKNGHPRTESSFNRKTKRINDINMERNVMFSGADYL